MYPRSCSILFVVMAFSKVEIALVLLFFIIGKCILNAKINEKIQKDLKKFYLKNFFKGLFIGVPGWHSG